MQSPNRTAYARPRAILRPKQKLRYRPPSRVRVPGPPAPIKIRRNHHLMPRIDGRSEPLLTSCASYDRQKRKVCGRRMVGCVRSSAIHSENTSGKLKASVKTKSLLVCIPENAVATAPVASQTPQQVAKGGNSFCSSKGTGSMRSSTEGIENSMCNVEEWLAVHPDLVKTLAPQINERKSVSQQEVNPPFPPSVEIGNRQNNPEVQKRPVPEILQDNFIRNFIHQPPVTAVLQQEPMNPPMFTVLPRGPPPVKGPWNKNFQQFVPLPPMLPANEMFMQGPPPPPVRPSLPYNFAEFSIRHGGPPHLPSSQNIPVAKAGRGPRPPPSRSYFSRQKKQTVAVNQPIPPPLNAFVQKENDMIFSEENRTPASIFVGNLGPEVDEVNLKSLFLAIGPVKDATVIREKGTMASKGFGFVTYCNSTHAQIAIEKIGGLRLEGVFEKKSLKVSMARMK